jgi:hypothetical protein
MTRLLGVLSAASLAVSLVACVSVTPVRGPDGETAHLIKCPTTDACYERAAEICPEGYVIRSNGSTVSGSVAGGSGVVSSTSEVLVSCKNDMPVAGRQPAAGPTPEDRDDARTCDAAYAIVDGFAAYWVRASNGKLLDEKTSKRDFVTTCRAMPENVQRCLHEKYRVAHAQACEAVLARLEPSNRRKIDSLFLQAPAVKSDVAGAN